MGKKFFTFDFENIFVTFWTKNVDIRTSFVTNRTGFVKTGTNSGIAGTTYVQNRTEILDFDNFDFGLILKTFLSQFGQKMLKLGPFLSQLVQILALMGPKMSKI